VLSAVGEEKKLAILFSDIRGFTPFAEALPPYDVVHVLNRYFHQMGRVITSFGGIIDNYAGDGLMALFGMNDSVEAPLQAVKAGLGMLEAVERLGPYLETIYCKSFQIGIGVHYGEVVVGEIGAENLKRVTAIGDAVNLASRIESANKQAGTRLLISEETYNEVKGRVNVGRTIRISLPGKSGEYTLYEVTAVL
jgi:adenylate cyclase